MGLSAQLQLDAGGISGGLLSQLEGPLQSLTGIGAPAGPDQIQQATGGISGADSSGIGDTVGKIVELAKPILTSLPGPGQLLGSLASAVDMVEKLTMQDLATTFGALRDQLAQEVDKASGTGLFGILQKLSEALTASDLGKLVMTLLSSFTKGSSIGIPSPLPVSEPLQAADGTVRAMAGLMALETLLSDAERVSQTIPASFDAATLTAQLQLLESLIGSGPGALSAFIDSIGHDDVDAQNAAVRALITITMRLDQFRERAAGGMGLAEASLAYLDVDKLRVELDVASAIVRSADLDPLGRQLTKLANKIQPLTSIDIANLPANTLAALLDLVDDQIAQAAAKITSLDAAGAVKPLTDGIGVVTGAIHKVSDVVANVVVSIRAAMETVRSAVAALPVRDITDAIKRFTEPIAQAIQAVRDLLQKIEQVLDAAAQTTTDAINQIDGFLAQFKTAIDKLFADAKKVVDSVNLDQVASTVQGNIKAFSAELAKAQMKPYFDTAVSAIGSAADVISKVPLGLLPDSMKADLDAVVEPIKEVDPDDVKSEIEGLLQIGPDGKFALRGDLEQAIAGIQQQYDAFVKFVKDHDPRTALADVDAKLHEIGQRLQDIQPAVTLQPVEDAVNQVKTMLAKFDLDALLKPVNDVFAEILDAIDQYSPAKLIEPFEKRLDDARQKLIDTIHFNSWAPALDSVEAQILGLINRVDPAQLQPQIESVLSDLQTAVNQFPHLPAFGSFGSIIASLAQGLGLPVAQSSFGSVLTWIGGASGTQALNGRADRIATALGQSRDAVKGLDLQTAAANVIPGFASIQTSVQGLIAKLDADSPQTVQLNALLPRLDAAGVIALLVPNQARFAAELESAASLAEDLRRTGFSEVDVTVHNFTAAIAPLQPAIRFLKAILNLLGLTDLGGGIAGVFRSLLAVATPQRLAGTLMPLFTAVRGRVQALLEAVLNPLKSGIADLKKIIDAIDLGPIKQEIDKIVQEVKTQIESLNPEVILKDPIDAFKGLQDDLVKNDPLQHVIGVLNALRDLIAKILQKLNLETLLATPLAIYDQIVKDLEKININGLLNPVFDQLDNIAKQVDQGLGDTVTAFKRLQAALPGGGGGSASVSVAVGGG
jgi:hypothetical protein